MGFNCLITSINLILMKHEGHVAFSFLLIDIYDREYKSNAHNVLLLHIYDTI